jgi:Do/DeqQ family serine protease
MDYNATSATPRRTVRRAGLGAAAGALLFLGSVAGWTAAGSGYGSASAAPSAPAASIASTAADRTIGASKDSYAGVVDQVSPAVVTIRAERRTRRISQQVPDDPFFRQFFGDRFSQRQAPPQREGALGSGVIVRPDGYILTNNHVVEGAEQVNVELTDGRTLKAKVVGSDAATDLAVLKVDGKNLQTLALGDSDEVRVGDVVLAVGNPLGVGQTVTMGIVSAKGRATPDAGDGYEDFIQTDAPINHGNSGGPLVSTRGELIGINSQILSPTPTGGNIGIGFAIPANMARNVMTQLIDHGTVRRGMIGVTIQPVTADIARSLGLSEVHGALVNSVNAGGPAETAGIRQGDVLTAINGQPVKDSNTLRNVVAQMAPGTDVKVTLLRGGKQESVDVKLAELQRQAARGDDDNAPDPDGSGYGMNVQPLTPDVAGELGVKARSGLVVQEVQPGGRAAEAGLRPGDVIVQVDGKAVASGDALRSALSTGDRPALLLVHRGATAFFLPLERAGK